MVFAKGALDFSERFFFFDWEFSLGTRDFIRMVREKEGEGN